MGALEWNVFSLIKTFLFLGLASLSFLALGGMAASFILYFKRGNPIAWIFSSISILMGGVYFPVELFPLWIQNIASYFPLTIALRGIRMSLLENARWSLLGGDLLYLAVFALFLLPLAHLSLKASLRMCRNKGNLSHQ